MSEKARSELIGKPIWLAAQDLLKDEIQIFSGQNLNVEPGIGLTGEIVIWYYRKQKRRPF